jgi:type IV pilus assembly protein PilW
MVSRTRTPQHGFSMVELMVALVLGVILTSGVISVYISSKASYNTGNSLAAVEETGRNALDFMEPIIALAGNTGCSRSFTSNTAGTSGIYYLDVNTGYATIGTPDNTTPKENYTPVYNFGFPVFGYEATGTGISSSANTTIPSSGGQTATSAPTGDTNASDWSPALTWNDPKNILWNALKGTVLKYNDVFMVHEALATPVAVAAAGTVSPATVTPSTVTGVPYTAANLYANEFAIASDCNYNTAAFQITSVTASTGSVSYSGGSSPGNTFPNAAGKDGVSIGTSYTVSPANTYAFYVGVGQDGWPALWEGYFKTDGSSNAALTAQELVSGVENMQVLYGVDTDNDQVPNYYATADEVQADANASWDRVVSIRVALVVQSDNYSVDKASTSTTNLYMLGSGRGYTDNVILATPADQRLRRVFIQTFSFRSMLP